MSIYDIIKYGDDLIKSGKGNPEFHLRRKPKFRVIINQDGTFKGITVIEDKEYRAMSQVSAMCKTINITPDLFVNSLTYLMSDLSNARYNATITQLKAFAEINPSPRLTALLKWHSDGCIGMDELLREIATVKKFDVGEFIEYVKSSDQKKFTKRVAYNKSCSSLVEFMVDGHKMHESGDIVSQWISYMRGISVSGNQITDPITGIRGEKCEVHRTFPGGMSKLVSYDKSVIEATDLYMTKYTEDCIYIALNTMRESDKNFRVVAGLHLYFFVQSEQGPVPVDMDIFGGFGSGFASSAESDNISLCKMVDLLKGHVKQYEDVGPKLIAVLFNYKQGRVSILRSWTSKEFIKSIEKYIEVTSGIKFNWNKKDKCFFITKSVPSVCDFFNATNTFGNGESKSNRNRDVGDIIDSIIEGTKIPFEVSNAIATNIINLTKTQKVTKPSDFDLRHALWSLDSAYKNNKGYNVKEQLDNNVSFLIGRWFAVQCNVVYMAFDNEQPVYQMLDALYRNPNESFKRVHDKVEPHRKTLKRDKPGVYINSSKESTEIMAKICELGGFPKTSLGVEFFLGYYSRLSEFFKPKAKNNESEMVA